MSDELPTFHAIAGDSAAVQPWYVAFTRPRMEQTARVNLERQGFDVYLPLLKTCSVTDGGLQPIFHPLFPRYVFVSPATARQSLSTVRSTKGVRSLVGFGNGPTRVPEEILLWLREFERKRNQADLSELSPIRPGARVRMRARAMNGIEGLVVSVAKHRVSFLLELLGREKVVTVEHHELELA